MAKQSMASDNRWFKRAESIHMCRSYRWVSQTTKCSYWVLIVHILLSQVHLQMLKCSDTLRHSEMTKITLAYCQLSTLSFHLKLWSLWRPFLCFGSGDGPAPGQLAGAVLSMNRGQSSSWQSFFLLPWTLFGLSICQFSKTLKNVIKI